MLTCIMAIKWLLLFTIF